jgi:hypothetical protein
MDSSESSASDSECCLSLHPSDSSMETEAASPQNDSPEPEPTLPGGVTLDRAADAPASNPEPSADIPPPQRSGYVSSQRTHYSGLALRCAQNRAIRQWLGPRYRDRALAATRLRTFRHATWSPEGKPSREALADAGFYYDGESQILKGLYLFPDS